MFPGTPHVPISPAEATADRDFSPLAPPVCVRTQQVPFGLLQRLLVFQFPTVAFDALAHFGEQNRALWQVSGDGRETAIDWLPPEADVLLQRSTGGLFRPETVSTVWGGVSRGKQ